jgi:hypothetical protein
VAQIVCLLLAVALVACSSDPPDDGAGGPTAGAAASIAGASGDGIVGLASRGGAAGEAGTGAGDGGAGEAGSVGGDGDAGEGGEGGSMGGEGGSMGGQGGAAGVAGVGTGGMTGGAGGMVDPCDELDCDDGNDCTRDACRFGRCQHENESNSGVACTDGFFDGQCLETAGTCHVQCGNTDQLCCEDECRPGLDCRPVLPDFGPITERCIEAAPCGGEGEPCCLELEGNALTTVCDGALVCGPPASGSGGSECNAE